MTNKFLSLATLFAAGTVITGAPTLGARTLDLGTATPSVTAACGSKEPAKDGAQATPPAKGAAKDGSCGKGSCGTKDPKNAKKGAKHKDGQCGAKKDGSCGKDKKEAPPVTPK